MNKTTQDALRKYREVLEDEIGSPRMVAEKFVAMANHQKPIDQIVGEIANDFGGILIRARTIGAIDQLLDQEAHS